MRLRRVGALGACAIVGSSTLLVGAGPASAEVPTGTLLVTGNFTGDVRDEIFYYSPGTFPDYLTGYSGDGTTSISQDLLGTFTVNATYTPLVGDLDADGYDEILWYAPGTATDYLWNFTSTSTVSSVPYTANGTYARPTVGDYTGDGADDVLWYAPGPAQDYLWDYEPGGGYVSTPRTISGTYIPVSGSFGNDATDDVFWYSPGPAADYLWNYVPGTTSYTQQVYAVSATGYRPFAIDMWGDGPGNEDIFWYAPGPGADYVWDFLGGQRTSYPESVNGEYLATAGDFVGDGIEDVVFEGYDRSILWNHSPDGFRHIWTWTYTAAAATSRASAPVTAGNGGPGVPGGEVTLPERP